MTEDLSNPTSMESVMNVVIIGKFSYPEGMAGTKRMQHFIDYLKIGHTSVSLLLLDRGSYGIKKNESTGCYRGTSYRKIGSNLRQDFKLIWHMPKYIWDGSRSLVKWRKKSHKNILFCYCGPDLENISFILTAKILGYKIVFDIVEDFSDVDHKVNYLTKIKIRSLVFLEKHLHLLADGLVVISKCLYDKYAGSISQKGAIKLIPVSAKVEEVRHKEKFKIPVRLVYSGSFAWKDGVDNLIEAFEYVYRQNKNIILSLTGQGDDENIARIKQKISGKEAIRYLGYLADDEFYKLLREADVLCMTRIDSKFANAGFPFKLGEYLATGNPVIASSSGDVSHYLEHMKDAVLIAPGDVREIEKAIEFLLNDQAAAIRIGLSGREKCREYFDPMKNGRLLMDLLNEI